MNALHKTHACLPTAGGDLLIIPHRSTTDQFLVIDMGLSPVRLGDGASVRDAQVMTLDQIMEQCDIWPEALEAIKALPKTTDPQPTFELGDKAVYHANPDGGKTTES
jgi:hypothetical protein